MNEIIVDFDQILDDEKFRAIEKIKTIGCTYMAASGINPQEDERDELAHLCDLVDFAIEMRNKLEDINTHSFNTFQLRIGIRTYITKLFYPKLQLFFETTKSRFFFGFFIHTQKLDFMP